MSQVELDSGGSWCWSDVKQLVVRVQSQSEYNPSNRLRDYFSIDEGIHLLCLINAAGRRQNDGR